MDSPSEEPTLGDYLLKELLAEGPLTRTWLAEQVSVRRKVLIDELRPEAAEARDSFLADVRSKAAMDHPLIGSVYEAVAKDSHYFFARERLAGATLEERLHASEPLRPAVLAHVLRKVAEANVYLESRGQATAPLDPVDIHLEDSGVVRLVNLAVAGEREPERSMEDIVNLGYKLAPLVADGHSGTTRLLTLFSWMRGEGLESPITWEQVRSYSAQIEQQLGDSVTGAGPATTHLATPKKLPVAAIAIAAAVVVIGLGIGVSMMKPKLPATPPKSSLPSAILIPEGKHPTPDGGEENLRAFRLSSHEVTIGEYAEFLDTLALLAKDQRERTFDHESQPAEKANHFPDDWDNLLAAAKSNGSWQGRPVALDTPVVGVDWWDATAYCEWKQGSLPTQEEWFAAMTQDLKQPSAIKPSNWLPVTAETPDRTPNGLLGMAGSVAEWTRSRSINPANPLGDKLWVIIGGSFLKPANGALAREWVEDRALRRPDLGFRLATDAR
ncbi:MAG: SUMF1/EgtB/PvdO family nonheme iron enzyme [Luteolibacter sp.]